MGEPDIDLYADDLDAEFNDEPTEYGHESNLDLYEDVIAPSDDRNESKVIDSPRQFPAGSRRIPVCVGNLTWWTTDKDLVEAISNIGVDDVADIKFHENRANGQSKGYCIVFVTNENSVKIISDKLPRKEIHGHTPIVTPYNKYNLNYFELQSKKGSGGRYENSDRRNFREKEWEPHEILRGAGLDRFRNRGNSVTSYHAPMQRTPPGPQMQHPPPQTTPTSYQPGHPWIPPPQISSIPPPSARPMAPPTANTSVPPPPPGLQGPPPPIRPGIPPPANVRVPPPRGPPPPIGPRGSVPIPDTRAPPPTLHPDWERQPPPHVGPPPIQHLGLPNRNIPPMSGPNQVLPSTSGPPPSHVPAPHVNPAFLQHQPPVTASLSSQASDVYNRPQYPDYRDRSTESVSSTGESEFDEIMSRNRSVSSSAISRAVADASVGDYAAAIETLVTAISLIKQSKVSNDERCKILISSLQDTLHGIESKSYGSRSKERARSRERDRSRERSSRREKSSRRDRSRSRDRDYRDRSRERDRYHEDRYKDRDHDRERRSRH